MTNAGIALFFSIYLCTIVLSLCTFAMAFWCVIRIGELKTLESKHHTIAEIEKLVNDKINVITSENLESGLYIPQKEPISGQMAYKKVSEQSEIQKWLTASGSKETDDMLQEMLEITGERRG